MIAGAVLAAGSSSRLKTPKQLVSIQGQPLLRRIVQCALPITGKVAVVLGAHADAIAPSIADLPVERLTSHAWEEGMAASVRSAAAWASDDDAVSALLLMVCDQTRLSTAHLRALASAYTTDPTSAIGSAYSDIVGVPAIFPRALFGDLLALRGDAGARKILAAHSARSIAWSDGAFDLDTPDDARDA